MEKSQNRLKPENCNKAMCKTCMFGQTPVDITDARKKEINQYLLSFESSHICHTTNKTCYGALKLQARMLYIIGIIKDDSVETFLEEAKKVLNL